MKIRIVLNALLITAVFAALASAQQTTYTMYTGEAKPPSIQLDDRYAALGYAPPDLRRVGIQWPSAPPDLAACAAQEPYEPHFTNLEKYVPMDKVQVRVQSEDECAWILAGSQWLWKKRPVGTIVAVDSQGRDLFDLGDGVGLICGNPRPVSYKFPPPPPPAPPPTVVRKEPPPEPVPTPPQEVVIPPPAHTCPTCRVDVEISPDGKTFRLVATFSEGYLSGTWYIDGKKIGTGDKYPVSSKYLLKLAGKGEHEIVYKAVDDQGHEVICGRAGIKLVDTKKGRYWVWYIPGLNCAYAWTADIKNWSVGGAIEKLGCVAAGIGSYYVVVHGTVVHLKIWVPGR